MFVNLIQIKIKIQINNDKNKKYNKTNKQTAIHKGSERTKEIFHGNSHSNSLTVKINHIYL